MSGGDNSGDRLQTVDRIQLNLNVRGLLPSATIAINDYVHDLQRLGLEVFNLGLGQSPFPVPEPVVRSLQENAHQKDYLPVKGMLGLRETIAEHHGRSFGIDCTAEDVLVGPGSKLLMFLLQLCYYGDLLIPTPCWVSYAPQAGIIGRHIFKLETSIDNDWFPTAAQLDEFCSRDRGRPRILVLNYPSNPTGRTLCHHRLQEIAEVAADHKVVVLSDEVYGKLNYEGDHESILSVSPEDSIYSGGLSKWCGAGGWRLGVFVFPGKLRWLLDAMAAVGSETFTSTAAPVQFAAVQAFRGGPEIEHYLRQSRRILKAVGGLLADQLRDAGARVLPPEGAFYLFPDLSPLRHRLAPRGIRTSTEMCARLFEETRVAMLPGTDFGRPAEELTARLAFVDFNGEDAMKAAEEVPIGQDLGPDFVNKHCSRVICAVERICEWMSRT